MGAIEYVCYHGGFLAAEVFHLLVDLGRPKWTVTKTLVANMVLQVTFLSARNVYPVLSELSNGRDTCGNTLMKLCCATWFITSRMLIVSCCWRLLMRTFRRYQLDWVLYRLV